MSTSIGEKEEITMNYMLIKLLAVLVENNTYTRMKRCDKENRPTCRTCRTIKQVIKYIISKLF